MARKDITPVITHTEILARAIRCIDADINVWRQRFEGLPEEVVAERLAACTEELSKKREALLQLYYFETGVAYE